MALFTSNFILRKDKKNSFGEQPILLTVYVSSQMRKLSTGLNIRPEFWDIEAKEVIYLNKKALKDLDIPNKALLTSDQVNEINNNLNSLKKTLAEKAKQFELEKTTFNVDTLVARFKDALTVKIEKVETQINIVSYLDNYLLSNSSTLNYNTAKGYRTLLTHIQDFTKARNYSCGFRDIDYLFMQNFYNYLVGTKNHLNVTAAKQISKLKAMLNQARKQGLGVSDTYRDYTIRKEEMEVIALNEIEFQCIVNLNLALKGNVYVDETINGRIVRKSISYSTLERTKDIFLFSCMTGLRYSDLTALTRENIKGDYISITIKKTKTPQQIPLISAAKAILAKYSQQFNPLPKLSNQKLNVYIKEIGKLADISELIQVRRWSGIKEIINVYPKYELMSAHTGRKTFVTISLAKGMNTELIMNVTGHKSYASFKRYLNVSESQTKNALISAWEK